MKNRYWLILLLSIGGLILNAQQWIRVNQMGYLPQDIKVAVWLSKENVHPDKFQVVNEMTGKTVYVGRDISCKKAKEPFIAAARLNFSPVKEAGRYYIKVGNVVSPSFLIGEDVYDGSADFLLRYMREQQCGYNPLLKDSCHRYDGVVIYNPKHNGETIPVYGGWHDASDYLKYVTTSANAVFEMLFAYQQNPKAFADHFDANGNPHSNGIPDILDEAKWGLDWLVRMNPDSDTYYNQVADDRDHASFRLPTEDSVDYGWGKGRARPVYGCLGTPEGLYKYKNRSRGLASTLGKYSSAYSLGAKLLAPYYPQFAALLKQKAVYAYRKGAANPGVCQTAPCVSPYFYEEDNWVDDMELAAVQLYDTNKQPGYLKNAVDYGRMEPVTPWMGADSAHHYQWYPFINLGHYFLALQQSNKRTSAEFIRNMRSGLERIRDRAGDDPFINGIPFIWCSNNLVVAAVTQCHLYRQLTGDTTFEEMEMALRDWLFGCNPWGKCMVIGLPADGDYPKHPHSALSAVYHYHIDGGLVDGPIYAPIFHNLRGVHLTYADPYAAFQSSRVVYHDDWADYSTNEPTMDGTASLCYYLSSLANPAAQNADSKYRVFEGGIIRGDTTQKNITLVFTGHEFYDGYSTIQKVLKKNNIHGAFFLTGDFYRAHPLLARQLQKDGNYMGIHSDKHLLYADWTKRDSTLVTPEVFEQDIMNNYHAMQEAGLKIDTPYYFLPAYEYYNTKISIWAKELGLELIDFTPGTTSNADYTTPDMQSYRSSSQIMKNILAYEGKYSLNGFLLLTHLGTDKRRTDKFYDKLDQLITTLQQKGYHFVPINALLGHN
ncbi:glycoside hydrolase family 9 protein [Microbacter margulisiae]|uniref:Peptidoglycan/xylan/chitin deacetylase (PgdA/CDA1 family) n=1 Tax=Microbacter margulisiae TaxID=1350067 RepID=A0A7W5DSE4_9PORP|nr:glycoside hydrolase family 9 protein [Microbacter margulisiae]MBB3188204.1 peptidoglycan/xylan/chitin deacetylase (PgdA/CDA1 family) [Microbacter margulisiae]